MLVLRPKGTNQHIIVIVLKIIALPEGCRPLLVFPRPPFSQLRRCWIPQPFPFFSNPHDGAQVPIYISVYRLIPHRAGECTLLFIETCPRRDPLYRLWSVVCTVFVSVRIQVFTHDNPTVPTYSLCDIDTLVRVVPGVIVR